MESSIFETEHESLADELANLSPQSSASAQTSEPYINVLNDVSTPSSHGSTQHEDISFKDEREARHVPSDDIGTFDSRPHSLFEDIQLPSHDAVACLSKSGRCSQVSDISPTSDMILLNLETCLNQRQDPLSIDMHTIESYLREMPSQTSIENLITRLVSYQASISFNVTNQARLVAAMQHCSTLPFHHHDNIDLVKDLIALVDCMELLAPTYNDNLPKIAALRKSSLDLQTSLSVLSDSLYVARKCIMGSSRILRSVNMLVEDIQDDSKLVIAAISWIENQCCEERLNARDCARICHGMIQGFERECNLMNARLTMP